MITKINGEQAFQILASSFVVSPSTEGYSLEVSADGFSFSPLFKVAPNFVKMVTNVVNGAFYRCKGNASSLTINWSKENSAQPQQETASTYGEALPEAPKVGQIVSLTQDEVEADWIEQGGEEFQGYTHIKFERLNAENPESKVRVWFPWGCDDFQFHYENGAIVIPYLEESHTEKEFTSHYHNDYWGDYDVHFVWDENPNGGADVEVEVLNFNPDWETYGFRVDEKGNIGVYVYEEVLIKEKGVYVCTKESTQGGDKEYVDSFESGVKEFGVEMDWTAWDYGWASFGDYFGWNGFQAGRENEGETPDENRTFAARYFAGGDWANFIKFESRPEEGASGSFDSGFVGNNWQAVGNWSFNNNILTVNFNLVQGAFGYTRSEDPYSKEKVFIFSPDIPAEWGLVNVTPSNL